MELNHFEDYKKSPENEQRQYIEFSEAQKNLFECEKIKAEVFETRKHFYQKPSFYVSIISALIPSILAIWAFYGTNAKDFFDNKVREIELNKRELNLQVKNLEQTKSQLVQDSLNLLAWDKQRKIELDEEYKEKELELEKNYQKKISDLEGEVNTKNETIENHLNEIRTSEKSKEVLKDELKKSLNSEKSKNELITRLQNENKTLKSKYNKGLIENEDSKKVTESLQVDLEELQVRQYKNEILIYLLSKGWVRVGFDRIRQDINPSLDNSEILSIIKRYNNIFSKTTLKGVNNPLGLKIEPNLTTNDMLK